MLELVFQHLELIEKEYFGLQFTENGLIPSEENPDILVCLLNTIWLNLKYLVNVFCFQYVQRWLNPKKSIKKQMRGNVLFIIMV